MELSEIINNSAFETGFAVFIGGAFVSMFVQKLKKWLSLQSKGTITFLVVLMSFIVSAVEMLLSATAEDPELLGTHTAVVGFAATMVYRYLVSPASKTIKEAKEFRSQTTGVSNTSVPVSPVPDVSEGQPIHPVSSSDFVNQ